jgi:taurine dioxygenase
MTNRPTIRRVAPACGAEVVGIDLRDPSPDVVAVLSRALADHAVLFVRDQHLTPEHQVQLTGRFGAVLRVPYITPLARHPDVIAVLEEADEHNISTRSRQG